MSTLLLHARVGRWALGLALLLLPACASADEAAPPAWIDAPPQVPGYIHAIGNYVGALYAEDNLRYALDKARGTLSKNLRSRVKSDTMVRETETRSQLDSEVQVTSDYVLENAEHVDTWVDDAGVRGRAGTVWVLMRVERR